MPADQARKLRSKLMLIMMMDDTRGKRKQTSQRTSMKRLLTELLGQTGEMAGWKGKLTKRTWISQDGLLGPGSSVTTLPLSWLSLGLEQVTIFLTVRELPNWFQWDHSFLKVKRVLNSSAESGRNPVNMLSLYHSEPLKLCKAFLKNLILRFFRFPDSISYANQALLSSRRAQADGQRGLFLCCVTPGIGLTSLKAEWWTLGWFPACIHNNFTKARWVVLCLSIT